MTDTAPALLGESLALLEALAGALGVPWPGSSELSADDVARWVAFARWHGPDDARRYGVPVAVAEGVNRASWIVAMAHALRDARLERVNPAGLTPGDEVALGETDAGVARRLARVDPSRSSELEDLLAEWLAFLMSAPDVPASLELEGRPLMSPPSPGLRAVPPSLRAAFERACGIVAAVHVRGLLPEELAAGGVAPHPAPPALGDLAPHARELGVPLEGADLDIALRLHVDARAAGGILEGVDE